MLRLHSVKKQVQLHFSCTAVSSEVAFLKGPLFLINDFIDIK